MPLVYVAAETVSGDDGRTVPDSSLCAKVGGDGGGGRLGFGPGQLGMGTARLAMTNPVHGSIGIGARIFERF